MPNDEEKVRGGASEGADERDREDDKDKGDKTVRQRLDSLIPDIVKKTFYTGLGAALTAQEQIREMAGEVSLPKDVASYVAKTADSAKDELFRIVARETREFLEKANLQEILAKLLTQLSLEVKTEIRFIPNDEAVGGVKPDIKKKVSIKRVREDGSTEEIDTEEEEKK